jgi:hypothetical protein
MSIMGLVIVVDTSDDTSHDKPTPAATAPPTTNPVDAAVVRMVKAPAGMMTKGPGMKKLHCHVVTMEFSEV